LLWRTADLVVDGYEEAIRYIDEDVDEIESQVFSADTADHSERIYKLKREIAEFRRAVLPLGIALQRLTNGDVPGMADTASHYFRDVYDHLLRAADAIEGHDRLLTDILQADLSRVAARQSQVAVRQNEIAVRQNEDMRKISAWAAIALVPTAIAGIYGMNFRHMPELGWRYGYFIALGVIATACLALYRLFRRNGWL
jgi:magnesium transporter